MTYSTAPTTILLIEDDLSISTGLRINLEAEGYKVLVESDGGAGLETARTQNIALIIVDVMLPHINGFEVVRQLRREEFSMPIIMLSARSSEIDKVMGLELGAEDYVTKPFGLAELLARVRVALRKRHSKQIDEIIRIDQTIEINTGTREVQCKGRHVDLTLTEFEVLMALVLAKGRVLSREQILEKVYGPNHHGTVRTVDNFLMQLRAKLETDPQNPRYLVTVRGVGYRFAYS